MVRPDSTKPNSIYWIPSSRIITGPDRPSSPMMVYKIARSALKLHLQNRWVDPDKCKKGVPEDLLAKLRLVLDETIANASDPGKYG